MEISLLRRRRTLRITEGEDIFLTLVHLADVFCFYILDGSAKGCFDLLSSYTGHLRSGAARSSDYSTLFFSLKKKEHFNIKEAHNHSFSHTVRGYVCFPRHVPS